MSYSLPTMRYERFPLMDLPEGLRDALVEYDRRRSKHGIAPCPAQYPTGHDGLDRLVLGLATLSTNSLIQIGNGCNFHGCPWYIRRTFGTLSTLQGLFYWNGSVRMTTAILKCAWRKGAAL